MTLFEEEILRVEYRDQLTKLIHGVCILRFNIHLRKGGGGALTKSYKVEHSCTEQCIILISTQLVGPNINMHDVLIVFVCTT